MLTINKLSRDGLDAESQAVTAARRASEISGRLEEIHSQAELMREETKRNHAWFSQYESEIASIKEAALEANDAFLKETTEIASEINRRFESLSLRHTSANHALESVAIPNKYPNGLLFLVGAVQKVVVDAKRDIRHNRLKDNVLILWYKECLNSARRDLKLRRLRDILVSRLTKFYARWMWSTQCQVSSERMLVYHKKIEDEIALLVRKDDVATRIDELNDNNKRTAILIEESRISTEASFKEFSSELRHVLSLVDSQGITIAARDREQVAEIQPLRDRIEELDTQIKALRERIQVKEEPGRNQTNRGDLLQGLLTDVLLLWNNYKQLDLNKLDKAGIDRINSDITELHAKDQTVEENAIKIKALEEKMKSIESGLFELRAERATQVPADTNTDEIVREENVQPEPKMVSRSIATRPSISDLSRGTDSMDDFLENARKLLLNRHSSRSLVTTDAPPSTKERKLNKINPAGGWGVNRSLLIRKCACLDCKSRDVKWT
jgi:hypothetical protein